MVSALESGSRDLGLRPGRVNVLCSKAKHVNVTVPLSTQEYKWVLANCQGSNYWGVTLQRICIPSMEE